MERYFAERLVYDGSDPSDDWVITEVGHSKLDMRNVSTVSVDSYNDYIEKCSLHDDCLGHMSKTPSGVVLPPQSIAVDTPVIRNDVAKAASFALQGTAVFHKDKANKILFDSMATKTGRMRLGVLNCHVDGSLRMIITPHQFHNPNVVYIPLYLKDKWKVVRLDSDTQRYVSRYVQDGDYAIALRCPSLHQESVQPVTLSFWNSTCVGVSPDLVRAFKGDYDGDEMHFYPVYSQGALEECKDWVNTPNKVLEEGRMKYRSTSIHDDDGPISFMSHTTVSFNQIKDGVDAPMMAEQTKTSKVHVSGLRKRFDSQWCDDNFIEDSIKGMGDINKQQLSQPIVGDMSRIARIAASCMTQLEDGTIQVTTNDGPVSAGSTQLDVNAGNTAVRAISSICAASQQSALDSHRAKDDKLPAHDLISDMIIGTTHTFVMIDSSRDITNLRKILKPKWICKLADVTLSICEPRHAARLTQNSVVGAYSPVVLDKIKPSRRQLVCRAAIEKIIQYHSLPIKDTDIDILAAMYSFRPGAHAEPITTRNGITARNLHWLDVTMATHYSGLTKRVNKKDIDYCPTVTMTSALVGGDFRSLQ